MLHEAHAALLEEGLFCTLDRRPRLVIENESVSRARTRVSAEFAGAGLGDGVASREHAGFFRGAAQVAMRSPVNVASRLASLQGYSMPIFIPL